VRSINLAPDKNGNTETALNLCSRCRYEWQDLPFGHARHDACPKCGSVYWQWLDYVRRT
jgi:hydrogenase maturation factor HypF (carbamoyltransferase family)